MIRILWINPPPDAISLTNVGLGAGSPAKQPVDLVALSEPAWQRGLFKRLVSLVTLKACTFMLMHPIISVKDQVVVRII